MTFAEFGQKYPARLPKKQILNADESRQLRGEDGVQVLVAPPMEVSERRVPATTGDPGCHLWVFFKDECPFILELAIVTPSLESGRVTHTNLTGGGAASSGGEVWFDPANMKTVYVNGCSGRYGPSTLQELNDAEDAFRSLGYQVESFGWDKDALKPATDYRR